MSQLGHQSKPHLQYIHFCYQITVDSDCSHEIGWCLLLGRKAMTNLDSILKNRHHFADKGMDRQSYGFSNSYVWMWELDHKEAWSQRTDAFKLWCWRRFLRVTWTARRSNQSILKASTLNIYWKDWCWSWSVPIFWPPDAKSWPIGKDLGTRKDWGQEKGVTEDEMIGWHHRLNGHEFEQTPESLACCSPLGHKESDTTDPLKK